MGSTSKQNGPNFYFKVVDMPHKDPEVRKAYFKEYRKKNPGKPKKYYQKNPIKQMLHNARNRARMKGLEFTITEADILVPDTCPILGIPIKSAIGQNPSGKGKDNSPSLDRVDNTQGYVPGNVRVISYKANSWKSNFTYADVLSLANYMKPKTQGGIQT